MKLAFWKNGKAVESSPSAEPVLSQPVQAIIHAMRDRPHTFGVVWRHPFGGSARYVVRDRATGLVAHVEICGVSDIAATSIHLPFCLTGDEQRALEDAGRELLNYKEERSERLRALRFERKNAASRREWCAKYNVRAEL